MKVEASDPDKTMEYKNKITELVNELVQIQNEFFELFGVNDIYSNSKIFEIIIANELHHNLIPGHSGSRNGRDENRDEYEYKHYKETSSNHTWTFNDFSDTTIEKLNSVKAVVFAHINDLCDKPFMDWCFIVPGELISKYLKEKTIKIINKRKMINVSPHQIEKELDIKKNSFESNLRGGYDKWLNRILVITKQIEKIAKVKDILTSNKCWELLIAIKLGHKVLTEQAAHDAIDDEGNYYEYKVSKTFSWNFQDISDNVLNKYLKDKAIILAVVDKQKFEIVKIYKALPKLVVSRLREKLKEKFKRFAVQGKELRRLQVSLSIRDLEKIDAIEIL
ncbi:MAG: hypothetical protein A2W07_00740 [candidate division Zixibacteria bacterium RBG_16_43_9]|nr:MAG: hypothetical protein A2W07_00740 [candidate division Zixibacteria bacterium RBG_16_43_9]